MHKSIIEHALAHLEYMQANSVYGCDLHSTIFNEDYFVNAEKWLNEFGVFNAINEIKEYEQDNFGEVTTDFSDSEKVANMYAYILGEILLSESETLREKWGDLLTSDDLKAIKEEIQ